MAKRRHIPEEFLAVLDRLTHAWNLDEAARVLRIDVDDKVESMVSDAASDQLDEYRAWAEALTTTNCGALEYQLGQLVLAEIGAQESDGSE